MASALYIAVKEDIKDLRSLLKASSEMMQPRIKMLIAVKKAGDNGIAKRTLMDTIGEYS